MLEGLPIAKGKQDHLFYCREWPIVTVSLRVPPGRERPSPCELLPSSVGDWRSGFHG